MRDEDKQGEGPDYDFADHLTLDLARFVPLLQVWSLDPELSGGNPNPSVYACQEAWPSSKRCATAY
jgi:hypothetical protein